MEDSIAYIPLQFTEPPQFEAFWFEKVDPAWWQKRAALYWRFPYYVCAVYLGLVLWLKLWMRNRKPVELRKFEIVWNLSMGLFCFAGFVRVAPELLNILYENDGFYRSVCVRDNFNRPAAFWGMMWCFSKYIQLVDTLIIVLRKKPLPFLYWYHHCVVVIVPWQIAPYAEPIVRWTGVFNYFVISLMYFYFGIKALSFKIPRKVGLTIAIMHVIEMWIGLFVNVYSAAVFNNGSGCARFTSSFKWTVFVYGSFLVLFTNHLYQLYFAKKEIHINKDKSH